MKSTPTRPGRRLPAALATMLLLTPAAAAAAPATANLYLLTPASAYVEGCFEPCMCPIMINQSLTGSFFLSPTPGDAQTAVYDVTDVAWTYRRGDELIAVTGGGTYTLGPTGHRLELDLTTGQDPPRHFDSGLVPAPGTFPAIDIAAAENGFFCYDYVFEVSANAPTVEVQTVRWGSAKATYR